MGKTKRQAAAYLIMSDITKRPYIDESRQAYSFTSEDAAEGFAENTKRAHVYTLENGMDTKAMSDCYAAGARTLVERRGGETSRHSLEEAGLMRRYYNPDLNADAARYISTQRMEYIKNMRRCRFIVPVRIGNHPQLSVMYATAVFSDDTYWYLVFTDLEEYEKWGADTAGWSPLEVRIDGLCRISRRHGFLLDACGARLLISRGMLRQILGGKEEKDV